LAADFTTANIADNQIYSILTASLPVTIIRRILFMSGDPRYNGHKLYDVSSNTVFRLLCPLQRYKNTSTDRLEQVEFYESNVRQVIYSLRGKSFEPLIEHIKSVFSIDPLPVREYTKAYASVLLSVLLYQILVYYNCKTNKENSRAIKYLLGT
jgi:hypothetical protein